MNEPPIIVYNEAAECECESGFDCPRHTEPAVKRFPGDPLDAIAAIQAARSKVRTLAEEARAAIFRLEEALGEGGEVNPHFDLRQRCYRARIEIGEAAHAFSKREEVRGRR